MAMKARLDGGRSAPTSLTVQSKMSATPTATDQLSGGPSDIAPRGNRSDITLRGQAKMWPTPKASEGFRRTDPARPGRTGGDSLLQAVARWPTPKARDAKGPENANRNSPSLETFAQLGHPDETTPTDGPTGPPEADLNPSFVESLMGLPDGWSDPEGSVSGFTRWVTDWSRKLGRTPPGN